MFRLRAGGRRWPFATRAALCMGVPVIVGWAAGDVAAGLMSTIGAFTALYGSGRPYLSRALLLGIVALSLVAAVCIGIEAARLPWIVVPFVAMMAALATFLCNALRVGPPGAYLFALACAAGTALPAAHLSTWHTALLVFAGGAFAWIVHMTGALIWPRGPERAAVAAAANAVAHFIEAIGTPQQDTARHAAALAMHDSWAALVSRQPARPRPDGTLTRLRALNRELHLLFATALNTPPSGRPELLPAAAERALRLGAEALEPKEGTERTDPGHVPLGHQGPLQSIREGMTPWSPVLLATVRVGIATAIAGAVGQALDLERTYWAMAAAVLMLHQGLDWTRTLQRGIERSGGTLVGLVLAGAILSLHPEGLWLAATMMVLQFTIEMLVLRNYALAVVFITAVALTIATGGHPVPDIGEMLWARGTDTLIGCAAGLAVFALTAPRMSTAVGVPQEIVRTLHAIRAVVGPIAAGDVTTKPALAARRDVQHRTIALLQAYDASIGVSRAHRAAAERMWPAVVATQRLAYRVLSVCWSLDEAGPAATERARALFGAVEPEKVGKALSDLGAAIEGAAKPAPSGPLPDFLRAEVEALRDCFVYGRR